MSRVYVITEIRLTLKRALRCLPTGHFGGTHFETSLVIPIEQRCHSNPPEMIATNGTFEACSDIGIPIVFTKFVRLVDPTISITEVSRLRVSNMNTKAFRRTVKARAMSFSSRRQRRLLAIQWHGHSSQYRHPSEHLGN